MLRFYDGDLFEHTCDPFDHFLVTDSKAVMPFINCSRQIAPYGVTVKHSTCVVSTSISKNLLHYLRFFAGMRGGTVARNLRAWDENHSLSVEGSPAYCRTCLCNIEINIDLWRINIPTTNNSSGWILSF